MRAVVTPACCFGTALCLVKGEGAREEPADLSELKNLNWSGYSLQEKSRRGVTPPIHKKLRIAEDFFKSLSSDPSERVNEEVIQAGE